MDLGFDVVVEFVGRVSAGELDQRHAAGDAEVGRFAVAVGVAERRAGECVGAQPQMGAPESRRGTHTLAAKVERAVDRPQPRGSLVIGTGETSGAPVASEHLRDGQSGHRCWFR